MIGHQDICAPEIPPSFLIRIFLSALITPYAHPSPAPISSFLPPFCPSLPSPPSSEPCPSSGSSSL